ncbi:MAG TPA: ferredoxin [Yinghuangia sp.]|nr:ferredoxin [Yinghuangia sp.]
MRASVDPELCAGHGACVDSCPDVFALTPGGFAEATEEEIPDEHLRQAEQAASRCPEKAITLTTA